MCVSGQDDIYPARLTPIHRFSNIGADEPIYPVNLYTRLPGYIIPHKTVIHHPMVGVDLRHSCDSFSICCRQALIPVNTRCTWVQNTRSRSALARSENIITPTKCWRGLGKITKSRVVCNEIHKIKQKLEKVKHF